MNSLQRRPSLAQRLALFREAVRGIWQGPIYSSDPNLREFFGTNVTATGVPVSEGSALTYAAVWSAVNCISGDIAALPLHMYRRVQDGGKEKFIQNPLYRLVHDKPNPEMTSIAWRRTIQAHALSWGNGYSEIVRDGAGRAAQLWPITPDRVTPYRRGSDSGLEYRIVNRDGSDSFIPSSDMLHIPGLGFDGIQGYSVIAKARESIGLGMAAERFGETFFGNGATFGGVISYPGPRPQELSEKGYRDQINSQHQGVDRAHKFLGLYNGATYTRLGIPPNDAQFLETRKFQISEIARWFNLPPHKLGDLERATHSNIEQQTIDYYTGTLLPWLKTWEQELYLKLVPDLERNIQFFEHVVDGLLRGDSQMRAEAFSKQFNTGSIKPNEIRDSENRNPIVGGDEAFVPLNTIPLSLVNKWFEADIEEKLAKAIQAKRPPPEPVAPTPTPDPTPAREIATLTEERDLARKKAQEAEDAKDHAYALLTERAADLLREETAHATTRIDGAAAIVRLTGEREVLRLQVADLETDVEAASTAVADADARTEVARAETLTRTGERDAAVTRAESAEADRAAAQITIEALSLDIVAAQQETARANERTQTVDAEHLASLATLRGELDAAQQDVTRATEQIATLRAEAETLTAARTQRDAEHLALATDLRSQIETLAAQLATATADALEARAEIGSITVARAFDKGAWEAEAQRLTALRTQADEVNAATVTELRAQIATVTQELAGTTAALLEARTVIGTLEATREADRASLALADQEVVKQSTAFLTVQKRLTETQQAIRATVVDVAERLIARESERARKAQGTPEKLSKWVDAFYPIHEDFCRMALKPAVRAVLVSQGSDEAVDRVLDRIVLAHISESSRQLQGVLQDADNESLAPALERVLRRWEAERAEALADRILKEAS